MREKPDLLLPFQSTAFRNIWTASLFSNNGQMILAVGAAWAMTQITTSTSMVALVQTASWLPMTLFALIAGSIADLYDRRRVILVALVICVLSGAALTFLSVTGALNESLILILCFLAACGTALYSPAWQASVRELVPAEHLPAAISLNSISYNVARSLGPAAGGAIVAALGSTAAFAANTLGFLPIMFIQFLRPSVHEPSSMPRESLGRALNIGVRYIFNAPRIRTVLIRSFTASLGVASIMGLMPLVTKQLVHGEALTYGILLGAFGVGAVIGAMVMPSLKHRYSAETILRAAGIAMGICLGIIALSPWTALTAVSLLPIGIGWTITSSLLNVAIQLTAPRWIAGRALATYQTAIAAGIALGSFVWGYLAGHIGLVPTFFVAGGYFLLIQVLGLTLPIPDVSASAEDAAVTDMRDPETALPIHGRSGPISIVIEHRIPVENVTSFRNAMEGIRQSKARNGAHGWTLGRDLAEPELWQERFHFPTWHDYLRYRSRSMTYERGAYRYVDPLRIDSNPAVIRRFIERQSPDTEIHDGDKPITTDEPIT